MNETTLGRTSMRRLALRRWARGLTHDELRGELDSEGLDALALEHARQEAHSGPTELGERLSDGRQRRAHDGGEVTVVEADHRQVVRHREPALPRRTEDARGHVVVRREDRGRWLGKIEEQTSCCDAARNLEVALGDEVGRRQHAGRGERGVVDLDPLLRRGPAGTTADMADAAV